MFVTKALKKEGGKYYCFKIGSVFYLEFVNCVWLLNRLLNSISSNCLEGRVYSTPFLLEDASETLNLFFKTTDSEEQALWIAHQIKDVLEPDLPRLIRRYASYCFSTLFQHDESCGKQDQ